MIAEYYIIINETAGSGRGKKVWETVQPILVQRQIHFDYHTTDYVGHATRLAYHFAHGLTRQPNVTPVLLVIGGDGTLNEALNGLLEGTQGDPIPIAYIPGGSGNDFARGLKMATNPQIALAQILNNMRPRPLSIGYYHETYKNEHRYFVNNVGLGFDAQIVDDTNRSKQKKGRLGHWAYLSNALKAYSQQEGFPLTVHVDRKRDTYRRAFLCTTSNHPYFGGGVKILPGADIHDDQLELIVVEEPHWWTILWLFTLLVCGGRHLNSRFVHHYRSHELHLLVNSVEVGQMDGQIIGNRNYDLYLSTQTYPFWIDTSIHDHH
ncbi:diacylglycerol/lipid kinase family protein [Lactiplantibacillus fabifermentans]|uniref:Transcription regulator n=2 Tax=Lactiplantibacillus fabifermentans TaxID=483011 RepID=A0A0R2NN10_9LACO|nr:diacylglycerol kinase family protein [Lactiplantibacillus fabifermentans]ETY73905.1 DeoR family transcriptional regulator [Lactiplantibacillus fabifermentans T30PCM01]KRO27144.1 transcription regulator [Lactiplantibacillus fabifermentans DSM 21115]